MNDVIESFSGFYTVPIGPYIAVGSANTFNNMK